MSWRTIGLVTICCQEVEFSNIQAVLFDKDGTLADSAGFLRSLGQKRSRLIDAQIPGVQDPLLMAFGFQEDWLNPAGLLAVGTRYENEVAAAAYVAETGRDWLESLELVKAAFREAEGYMGRKADHTPLFDGVQPVLAALNSAGVKIGILSSDTTQNVEDFVDRYELAAWVDLSMGTEQGPAKPDPALVYQACEILGVEPAATLVIGDSALDWKMARAAETAGFIAVAWGSPQSSFLKQADAQIAHWAELEVHR